MSLFAKKAQPRRSDFIAALDIGSSKLCCSIASFGPDNSQTRPQELRLTGVGHQISRGVKGGMVVDMDSLEDAILNAVHSAEQSSGQTITALYVNLPARGLHSTHITSEIPLVKSHVTEAHIRKLLSSDYTQQIPTGHQVIHALPISFSLDGIPVKEPRGMFGEKLRVRLHVISASISVVQNLTNCIGRCHLDVAGFVATPYASGLSSLVDDELELGATIIDLGGGTTTIATFIEGAFVHIDSIPIGGNHITNDIARGLSTPISQAERLKILFGSLLGTDAHDRETISIPHIGEDQFPHAHHVSKTMLSRIISARVEEILDHVIVKMTKSLPSQRIVFTGGGSQLFGLREIAVTKLNQQVRIAHPQGVVGTNDIVSSPVFSTCSGLLQYGLRDMVGELSTMKITTAPTSRIQGAWSWVKENF